MHGLAQQHRRRSVGSMLVVALGAALVALAVSAAPALAQTQLYVSTGGSDADNNNCQTQASPCLTIGQAVAGAADGDTINIAAGTYNEAISTSLNGLSFVGTSGAAATTIDATGLNAPALSLSGTADGISGLTLETNDSNVAGALDVSGSGTVTVTGVSVSTDSTGGPTDGIDFTGASLTVTDSTISVTNTDAAVETSGSPSIVVDDGSGIEDGGGTVTVNGTTIHDVEGIALRIHAGTTSTTVRDSLLESSGTEDLPSSNAAYAYDQWPVIQAGSGTVALHDSTVYNATVGVVNDQLSFTPTSPPTEYGAETDALWVPNTSGTAGLIPATVTLDNTILHTQPNAGALSYGADIDTGVPVSATDSAYTTVDTNDTGSAPSPGTGGIIAGDPGLDDPLGAIPDFTLAAGSALLGDGDPSDDLNGELDLGGNSRTTTCSGPAITNIGAFETAVPQCPAALSSADSTGALTQLTSPGNCITGDTAGNSGCGTASQPGMVGGPDDTAPTDTVQSADGKNVYVATEDPKGNGVDIAELKRAANGGLSELASSSDCVEPTSGTGGCGTTDAQLLYGLNGSNAPIYEPTRMAITPDGENLYVDNGAGVAEFSRDPSSGALTPLASADCISYIGQDPSCTYQDQDQVAAAAAMLVSPNSDDVYVATLNQCSHQVDPGGPPGDNQNPDCRNDPGAGYSASADVAVLTRDPSTGLLAPGPCYDNTNTPQLNPACTGGFDGLYWMTSMAMSSDNKYLYVTSQVGAAQDPALSSDPFDALSRDPGEVTELSVDPSTGDLSQIAGGGACVTAGIGCGNAGDTGQSDVAGVADPQQIVLSPDGKNAYVTGAQYTIIPTSLTNGGKNGALVGTTLAQLSRDPSTGKLTSLSGATCFAGYDEACGTANGPGSNVTQVPALTGAEALAVSPDGLSVYATAENDGVNSAVVEFSRDAGTGELTPLSTPDLCLSHGSAPGAGSPYDCNSSQPAGLSDSVGPLPGGVLVAPDCQSALVMSDGLAEFSRNSPGGNCLSTVGFSVPSLSFTTAPSTTSGSQTVTVTNNGSGDLVFGADALTLSGTDPGDFALTGDTCSSQSVAPTKTCTFSADFMAPGSGGTFGADVLLADNAAGSPQSFSLHGVGGTAGISFSATPLAFVSSSDRIGLGTSATETETVTNSGSAALLLGTLSLSGPQQSRFTISADACSGQTLQADTSCKVQVKYTPDQAGSDTAALNIPNNASGSPQAVPLAGFAGVPSVGFDPSSPSFTNTGGHTVNVVDTSSDTQLTVDSVSITGPDAADFSEVDECAGAVDPGDSCGVFVTFTSDRIGTYHAELSVSDNGAGSPQTVALTGNVVDSLSGTVLDDTQTPPAPVQGAMIEACPRVEGLACQTTTTAADGSYGFPLGSGSWLVQLTPPTASLFGGQAVVQITAGRASVQNFDLTAPIPLSGGISVDGHTAGVPTVNWIDPFDVHVPLDLPTSGTPGTTNIFVYITGLTGAGSAGADTGVNLAMLTMFGVHYGSDGLPDAFGPSFSTQLDCTGTPSPCAAPLSGDTQGAPPAGDTAAAAHLRGPASRTKPGGEDPIAHAAGCPPGSAST